MSPYSPDQSSLLTCCFRMVNDLGGKIKVMELMSHESGDVKYQALLTVSSNIHSRQGQRLIHVILGSAHNVTLVDFIVCRRASVLRLYHVTSIRVIQIVYRRAKGTAPASPPAKPCSCLLVIQDGYTSLLYHIVINKAKPCSPKRRILRGEDPENFERR